MIFHSHKFSLNISFSPILLHLTKGDVFIDHAVFFSLCISVGKDVSLGLTFR